VREDGLDGWVTYWAEKQRSRRHAQHRIRRIARESHDDWTQLVYDMAMIVAGILGIAALLHVLIAGISG